jgi:multidrug transporter EmrE-like cation transporter
MLQYLFATYLASIDSIILPILKAKRLGIITGTWMLPLAAIMYSIQPLVFYQSLSIESMTVMNIMWDVISDILVSIIGIFVFNEYLSPTQLCGLVLSVIGLVLLGYK